MQNTQINDLQKITEAVLKQCIKNVKDIESIINALQTFTQPTKEVMESELEQEQEPEPEQTPASQLVAIDNSIASHDIIIARRIGLHKELGSYIEPQTVRPDDIFPTITPLSKLNKFEQNTLYKKIWTQATHYIKDILRIETNDATYDKQITIEADRLLAVWCDISKKH